MEWSQELRQLSTIAKTQPHAAFAAYTHGLKNKWSYLSRIMPDIGPRLQALRSDLIPNLTGRPPPNSVERNLLALPARLGGLGIIAPPDESDHDFKAPMVVTAPLRMHIHSQDNKYPIEALEEQISAKSVIRRERQERSTADADSLKEVLTPSLKKAMTLARERGASSWLTTLPIKEHGFCLHKGAFADALALRYGWPPDRMPTNCVCAASFTVEHSLSCPRGGFPSICHNKIRDLTASLLTEVCHDVCTEPSLQSITDEVMARNSAITTDGARLDIAANGI